MTYYVDILKSQKDNGLYIGLTKNLPKRIKEHNLRLSNFTKPHAPYKLISYIAFADKLTAARFGKYLKSTSGKAFINKHLIK